jgi:hypothetical protein
MWHRLKLILIQSPRNPWQATAPSGKHYCRLPADMLGLLSYEEAAMPRYATAVVLLLCSTGPIQAETTLALSSGGYSCADPGDPSYSYAIKFDGTEYTLNDQSGSETGTWALAADGTISFADGPLEGSEASLDGESLVILTLDAGVVFRCTPT